MRILSVTSLLLLLSFGVLAQQNSVGINVSNGQLNPNAVLELVSPNSNQGFLVPRLSTQGITALVGVLTDADNGLIVYDLSLIHI